MSQSPSKGLLPEPSAAAGDDGMDLDARIFQAEQAVVARDERLRSQLSRLGRQAQQSLGAGLRMSLFGFGASALLAFLRPSRATAAHAAAPPWWTHWLPLVWPWMPRAVRRSVSPATAALVLDVVLPLFRRRARVRH